MHKWLSRLFPHAARERHTDEVREATHEAMNDLQRAVLKYQAQSKQDKKQIIDILSKSESELHSVAEMVAEATSAKNRGYKNKEH